MSGGLLYTNFKLNFYLCDDGKREVFKVKFDEIKKPISSKVGLLQILQYLRRHLLLTLAATGSAVLAAIMSILSPIYVSKLIDSISESLKSSFQQTNTNFTGNAMTLLGISLINAVLTSLYIKLIGDLGEKIAAEMRTELFERILHETVGFFDGNEVSELLSKLSVDVQNFKHSLKQILTTGIRASVQMSSSLVQMVLISQTLSMNLGFGLPLIFIAGNSYGRYLRFLASSARETESKATNCAHEALLNIKTVKSFVSEDFEVEKYSAAVEKYKKDQQKLLGHVGIFQGLTVFSVESLVAAVLYLGGIEVISGRMSHGGLLSFLMSLKTAQKSLTQFVTLNAKWQTMLSDFERIETTVQSKNQLEDLHDGIVPQKEFEGKIEFRDVTFTHRGREKTVVSGAELSVAENEVIGIIGESGSGKSTIISLLARFYDPEGGQILIDEIDIKTVDLKWLRQQIGIVPQEPVLFSGSIKENIAYGVKDKDFTDEEVIKAAKEANIHEFIVSLPQGYSTNLSKCSLSGGQKQRIAIARVLLRSPKILILDEATSALDEISETAIHETLKKVIQKGRTVIIISHKKGILELADKVYKLEGGKFEKIK